MNINTINNEMIITNSIACEHCGCVDEPMYTAVIDGNRVQLCMDCIESLGLVMCEECGEYHTPYEDMTRPDGYAWVCDSCLDEHWVICDECGDYVRRDDAVLCDGYYYCDYCADRYLVECAHCGEYHRSYNELYGVGDLCRDCYNELTEHFHDYGYKPEPEFYREYGEDDSVLTYGVEAEVDDGENQYALAAAIAQLSDVPVYCKHDGSLGDTGVEIVSHPCTLRYHAESFDWDNLFRICHTHDYIGAESCGLHIHVGRHQMGADERGRRRTAAKTVLIVNSIWDELVEFSGRTEDRIEDWCNRPSIEFDYYTNDNLGLIEAAYATVNDGRYQAVNLTNRGTVEFRIFSGTTSATGVRHCLRLVDSIVRYAMTHSATECRSVQWDDIIAYQQVM